MVSGTRVPQGTRLIPRFTLEVTPGMSIANAIANADAIGGDWTILLYTGVYAEGDLTPNGGANITIKGLGEGRVEIAPGALPATATIVSGFTLSLEDIIVTAFNNTVPALAVVGSICSARHCNFNGAVGGDSIDAAAGTVNLNHCSVDQDIELHMNPCTLLAWDCDLDAINTAAELVAHVVRLHDCNLGGAAMALAATGACTYEFHNCMEMSTITDASLAGTGHLCQCDIVGAGLVVNGTSAWVVDNDGSVAVSNTNAAATIEIYGGIVLAITRAIGSVVWWQDSNTLKVIPCTVTTDTMIGWALAAAAAGDVILLHPGTYQEAITCVDGVGLKGVGTRESVIIYQNDATIFTMPGGGIQEFENLTLRLGTLSVARRFFYNPQGGIVRVKNVVFEVTAPGAHAVTILYNVRAIDAAFEGCSFIIGGTGASITIYSTTNVASIRLINNDFQWNNVNATHIYSTAANTFVCSGNRWAGTCHMWHVTSGTILLSNDSILTQGDAWNDISGGSVCMKNSPQQYEIVWPMLIQHAVTAAAADTPAPAATAPYTMLIHPGIYDEVVTCSSWVNVKGIGPKRSVVIQQTDATTIILANNVELDHFTVRLVTPTDNNRRLIWDNTVACTAKMSNLVMEITTPGAFASQVFLFTGAGTYVIEECYYDIGGTGLNYGIQLGAAANVTLNFNDFTFSTVSCSHITCSAPATVTGHGNTWSGPSRMFNNSLGTFTFDNDAIRCTGTWVNVSTTMTLRHCTIESPVTAGNTAVVRLKDCSYRAIQRVGTGNIVDESPQLQDAPWKVHKWTWQAALASAQVAARGTPIDAGTGQVLLEVTDNVAGQEAVETLPIAAGALTNQFTPARTPRCLMQISVDSFDAHVTMFFGLRETLGNAVPAAGEHHAGFDWDGTNFRAINGAAAQSATNLATPSTGTHHQLEVIIIGGVQVEFYVDGVLVHTETSDLPTNTLDWQHLLATAGGGGGGGDEIDVTVRPGGCQECPA